MTGTLSRIPIDQIERNPQQPRQIFDNDALVELAASIKADGLMQPITVRPMPGGSFQLLAGERRWRAHRILKDRGDPAGESILCHVRQMDDLARDISAIIENLLRVDVTPLEEAQAFGRLVDSGLDPDEIAKRTGAMGSRVKQRLALLKLDPSIAKLLAAGQLPADAAVEIARLPEHRDQLKIVQMINRGQIAPAPGARGDSVRSAVNAMLGEGVSCDMFGTSAPPVSKEEIAVFNRMERKIEDIVRMISQGWRDGECVVANRVDPNRAKTMAEKLLYIRNAIRTMERQLRNVTAQAVIKLEELI